MAPTSDHPTPGPGATIYVDTRAGGAQDLQAAGVTTLAQADALLNAVAFAGSWDFTTNQDGNGRHAYVAEWLGQGTNCVDVGATRLIYFTAPYPTHVLYQWKQWMGRTVTGGGIGAVGDFTIDNPNCGNAGRKMWLALREHDDAGGRVDYVWGGPYPPHVDIEGWYGLSPGPGTVYQNQGQDFHPETAIGQVNTYTLEYKAESVLGVSDGLVRLWVNGILRLEYLNQPTGVQGFAEIQFPATFRAPLRDQTEYFWDLVMWTPSLR